MAKGHRSQIKEKEMRKGIPDRLQNYLMQGYPSRKHVLF